MQRLDFERNNEIGAFCLLTNTYSVIGESSSKTFYSTLENSLEIPIIETRIGNVRTIGSLCVGNSKGLILPGIVTDEEIIHIRNSIPENVKVKRIVNKTNAFGNIVCCNENFAIIHPDVTQEAFEEITDVLGVEGFRIPIGDNALVGTYALMNNQGILVHPMTSSEKIDELHNLLDLRVVAGTVNSGKDTVGSGAIVNDWIGFIGSGSTNTEITVMESVFNLKNEDNKMLWVEEMIN